MSNDNKHTVTIIPLEATAQVFASHIRNIDGIIYNANGQPNTHNTAYVDAAEKYKEALANLFITKHLIPSLNTEIQRQEQKQVESGG